MAPETSFNFYRSCKENTGYDKVQIPKKDLKNQSKDKFKKQALKERASNKMRYNYNDATLLNVQKSICCGAKSWAAT